MYFICKKSLKIPKGSKNLQIEEGQITPWPNEKGQTTIYKTPDRNCMKFASLPKRNNSTRVAQLVPKGILTVL